jgi:hypothetical protein
LSLELLANAKSSSIPVLTFIDISATFVGVPASFSFYLVSIGNACAGIGRISTALLVDKLGNIVTLSTHRSRNHFAFSTGAINMIVPMTSMAAIATFVWPFLRTKDGLIAITVLYGLVFLENISASKFYSSFSFVLQFHDRSFHVLVSNASV